MSELNEITNRVAEIVTVVLEDAEWRKMTEDDHKFYMMLGFAEDLRQPADELKMKYVRSEYPEGTTPEEMPLGDAKTLLRAPTSNHELSPELAKLLDRYHVLTSGTSTAGLLAE